VRFEAPTALLATGVVDRLPDIPGLEAAIRRGHVRMCPICDAYEATDARIAVLGSGPLAQREADFLRTYSPDVTVLIVGEADLYRLKAGDDIVYHKDLHPLLA